MKIYNTLSRKKEDFLPQGDPVKMYVCGVTPYAEAHIGHAMSYIIFDVIRRYLEFGPYRVKYVQNITDIDDKIIDRANLLGLPYAELAQKYTDSFREDMAALNVMPPDETPRATGEIPKIIEVITGLVDKGYAYEAQGSVYFRVRKVADYGKLSRRDLESMMSSESTVGSDDKESPMDFVLWKAAKAGEPSWDSPWGPGRPGWHIECSAMSLKYLGDTIDIHGGGQDLIFPHHENEIAQSESFSGKKPFVKYWLHNGLLQFDEEKMSKSLGNLITIKEALQKYSADAIRTFVLIAHYRSPLTYSEEALEAAESGVGRLRQAADEERAEQCKEVGNGKTVWVFISPDDIREKFKSVMDDDFGTPRALSCLFTLASEINQAVSKGLNSEVVEHRKLLKELAGVLGLTLKLPPLDAKALQRLAGFIREQLEKDGQSQLSRDFWSEAAPFISGSNTESLIRLLISTRDRLREDRQFQLADEIRAKLDELDITLEDNPSGTLWKRIR